VEEGFPCFDEISGVIQMAPASPRVLIVDDHKVFAETLGLALRMNGFDDVLAVDDVKPDRVLEEADTFKPHVVLLDLQLDRPDIGLSMIAPLVGRGIKVLVLTPNRDGDELLAEALEAGAAGLFDKSYTFDHLLAFILDAASGLTVLEPSARQELLAALRRHRAEKEVRKRPFDQLSARERAVLTALTQGKSADEIATDQFVAITTVRSQIRGILQKLGVNSQLAAVALARRAEWEAADG
jgi:DNA-binding NarL/FixJ family response regulator